MAVSKSGSKIAPVVAPVEDADAQKPPELESADEAETPATEAGYLAAEAALDPSEILDSDIADSEGAAVALMLPTSERIPSRMDNTVAETTLSETNSESSELMSRDAGLSVDVPPLPRPQDFLNTPVSVHAFLEVPMSFQVMSPPVEDKEAGLSRLMAMPQRVGLGGNLIRTRGFAVGVGLGFSFGAGLNDLSRLAVSVGARIPGLGGGSVSFGLPGPTSNDGS